MTGYVEIAQALRAAAQRRPDMADTIDLHCRLLEIQSRVSLPSNGKTPSGEQATARLASGLPILDVDGLSFDADALRDSLSRICQVIAETRAEFAQPVATLQSWLRQHNAELPLMATEQLRTGSVNRRADPDVSAELLAFVFNAALRPFLRAKAEALAGHIGAESWHGGLCPVCGGEPDLAALTQPVGERRLLCSRCDSEWAFARIGCPFCRGDELEKLHYFAFEDKPYRLNVCDACGRYLKTVDQRETIDALPLPAERVLSIGLDFAAMDAGYKGDRI